MRLEIIGLPAPKGSFVRMPNGATVMGTSKTGRQKMAAWGKAVEDACRLHLTLQPAAPIVGPIHVTIAFRFPPTKSDPYRFWHTSKPDADKCARLVLDSLKLGALIADDALVCKLTVSKRYVNPDENSGASVDIELLASEEAELRERRKQRAQLARRKPSAADHQAALL